MMCTTEISCRHATIQANDQVQYVLYVFKIGTAARRGRKFPNLDFWWTFESVKSEKSSHCQRRRSQSFVILVEAEAAKWSTAKPAHRVSTKLEAQQLLLIFVLNERCRLFFSEQMLEFPARSLSGRGRTGWYVIVPVMQQPLFVRGDPKYAQKFSMQMRQWCLCFSIMRVILPIIFPKPSNNHELFQTPTWDKRSSFGFRSWPKLFSQTLMQQWFRDMKNHINLSQIRAERAAARN